MAEAEQSLVYIVEAALFAADKPLTLEQLQGLFDEGLEPTKEALIEALTALEAHYQTRGIQLTSLATGYRFQTRVNLAYWVQKLWEEKPPRLSRAVLETLALMAYRQPITRGEIEEIRGVSVSSHIVRTLMERGWIRVVGHKEVPGRPALYATTNDFLAYFNLQSLDELPSLAELQSIVIAESATENSSARTMSTIEENNPQQPVANQATIAEPDSFNTLDEINMEAVDSVLAEFDQRFKVGQSFNQEDVEARSESLPLEPEGND